MRKFWEACIFAIAITLILTIGVMMGRAPVAPAKASMKEPCSGYWEVDCGKQFLGMVACLKYRTHGYGSYWSNFIGLEGYDDSGHLLILPDEICVARKVSPK